MFNSCMFMLPNSLSFDSLVVEICIPQSALNKKINKKIPNLGLDRSSGCACFCYDFFDIVSEIALQISRQEL